MSVSHTPNYKFPSVKKVSKNQSLSVYKVIFKVKVANEILSTSAGG